jgi:LPXTG-motif cell wall-anchored protein
VTVFVIGTVALFALLGTSVAWASYGSDGGISLSNTAPSAGSSVTITSTGWMPNTSVTVTLQPVVLTTATADATGTVHVTVTIPSNTASGSHTIELTGTSAAGAPRTVSTPITVSTGGGGNLPRTGAAIAALFLVGIALFGVGSALSAARKRAVR